MHALLHDMTWGPLLCSYVIFTAVVVLSERVEATVQKGVFRFFGTVIGGALLSHLVSTAL